MISTPIRSRGARGGARDRLRAERRAAAHRRDRAPVRRRTRCGPRARECDEAAQAAGRACSRGRTSSGWSRTRCRAEHGGGGERSAVTGALIAEELAWGDLAIALAILSPVAGRAAGRGLRQRRAEAALAARATPASASCPARSRWSSRSFGADRARARTTRARRDGDDFVLDGAQVPGAVARRRRPRCSSSRPSRRGPAARSCVPRDARGPRRHARAQHGHPRAADRGARARGRARARRRAARRRRRRRRCDACSQRGRVALAAPAIGVARAAFEIARDYAKERQTFGAPIATKQAIAFKLADMAIEIDGARLLAWEAAWRLDAGPGRAARGDARAAARRSASRSRSPTAPCRCSAATATSASTCPSCTCATRAASPLRSPGPGLTERGAWRSAFEPRATRTRWRAARTTARWPRRADAPDLAPATTSTSTSCRASGSTASGSEGRGGPKGADSRAPRATASCRSACRPRSCAGATPACTCACRRRRSAARRSRPPARPSRRSASSPRFRGDGQPDVGRDGDHRAAGRLRRRRDPDHRACATATSGC